MYIPQQNNLQNKTEKFKITQLKDKAVGEIKTAETCSQFHYPLSALHTYVNSKV